MRQKLSWHLAILALVLPLAASAQEPHGSTEGGVFYDPVVAPLVLPTSEDFLPAPAPDGVGVKPDVSPVGLGAFIDVTGDLTLFNFAPWYTFSDALKLKVRVPWIFKRTLDYYDWSTDGTVEAEASGLGDIAVDAEYTHRFAAPGQALRLQASVKLPTGDQDKMDGDYPVPLGTGSVDILARVQYARSTERTGLVVTALYRQNTEGETIRQGFGMTTTNRVTAGNQFVAATFARHRMTEKLWVHLGAGLMLTGDGEVEVEDVYDDGTRDSYAYSLAQKSTLVDLFPGFSWDLGPVSPYLGVRIPVVTSYDQDGLDESRDVAVTLQVTYRPDRLF